MPKLRQLQASQRIAKEMTNIADVAARESAKAAKERMKKIADVAARESAKAAKEMKKTADVAARESAKAAKELEKTTKAAEREQEKTTKAEERQQKRTADVARRESAKAAKEQEKTAKAAERLQKQTGEEATKKTAKFGMGLMALGNAVDDLQYGFRSVVNNIPQMLYLMGASGGVAGAASIAAVAVNQLLQHWEQLADAMKAQWMGAAAGDLARLRERAENAAEAFADLKKQMNPAEAEQKNLWQKAMVEPPGGAGAFMAGLQGALKALPGVRPGEGQEELIERKKIEDRKAVIEKLPPYVKALAITKDELKKIDDRLQEMMKKRLEEIMGGLVMGGPESETYRAFVRDIMETKQFKQFFLPEARMFARMADPGRVERRLKAEKEEPEAMRRQQEEEAANKAAAGKMASGPLGTAILYGAVDKQAAARKITQKEVIARARQLYEKEEAERKAQGRGSLGKFGDAGVIPRFAPQARQQLRDEQAKLPEAASDLEKAAKQLMQNAGIAGDPKGVVAEIRKLLEERRSDIMARTGATKEQAEAIMKREQMHAAQGAFGPPAQRMGLVEFSHMTQGGILNNQIPAQQLEQLRKMNITLDMIARHGRPRVPAVAGK